MISSVLQDYIEKHFTLPPKYLEELERETYLTSVLPQMISGRYQGRVLSLLSKLIKPKEILEIGTFTGYSSLCLAEGLKENGTIHTIDINDEFLSIQNKYFEKSPYRAQIKQYTGDAKELIPKFRQKFDLIFLDADKQHYPKYFELVFPLLNKNGLLIADNVLWYEKVAQKEINDKETSALRKYNKLLTEHPEMEVVILPIRDGISIGRRI